MLIRLTSVDFCFEVAIDDICNEELEEAIWQHMRYSVNVDGITDLDEGFCQFCYAGEYGFEIADLEVTEEDEEDEYGRRCDDAYAAYVGK